jgi:hypothetical protein
MKESFILGERGAKTHRIMPKKTAGEISQLCCAGLPREWLVVTVLPKMACQPEEEL